MIDFQSFFKLTYGLYVVSSVDGESKSGHVSNTVFQVSAEPPLLAIATHKNNYTTGLIQKSGVFSVSVIQQDVSMEFMSPWGFKSGRDIRKFEKASFFTGQTGCPVLQDNAVAWFECRVSQTVDVGTHLLVIGSVVSAEVINPEQVPLAYSFYREKIKGLSPANSPTYLSKDKLEALHSGQADQKENKDKKSLNDFKVFNEAQSHALTEASKSSVKYQCKVCGYVYDPEEGDPPGGIAPGTAFEDIPDDWECPICGVKKSDFVMLDF